MHIANTKEYQRQLIRQRKLDNILLFLWGVGAVLFVITLVLRYWELKDAGVIL